MPASRSKTPGEVDAVEHIIRSGVVSDTHGWVPPDLFEVFAGVRRTYHCGDIGSPTCAIQIEDIAQLKAVSGNMDPWETRNEGISCPVTRRKCSRRDLALSTSRSSVKGRLSMCTLISV